MRNFKSQRIPTFSNLEARLIIFGSIGLGCGTLYLIIQILS